MIQLKTVLNQIDEKSTLKNYTVFLIFVNCRIFLKTNFLQSFTFSTADFRLLQINTNIHK